MSEGYPEIDFSKYADSGSDEIGGEDIYVVAEDLLADMAAGSRRPRRSGGKAQKGSKKRQEDKKAEAVGYSIEKRGEKARDDIRSQLSGTEVFKKAKEESPDSQDFLSIYAEWVVNSINQSKDLEHNAPVIEDGDIEYSEYKASSGPGGQHLNKVATAVRAKHLWTGITVQADTRKQKTSREQATKNLKQKLSTHLDSWETLLGTVSAEELMALDNSGISEARQKFVRQELKRLANPKE